MSEHKPRSCSPAPATPESPGRPEKRPRLEALYDDEAVQKAAESTSNIISSTNNNGAKSKKPSRRNRKQKHALPEPYSPEFVIAKDVENLLGKKAVEQAIGDGTEWDAPLEQKEEIQVTVSCLSSTGDALCLVPARHKPWAIVAPLALPGETIRVRVYKHARLYSHADLLDVVTPNPEWRDMDRVQCKYFGKCAGCQYQMLSYKKQLDLKRDVVVKAYQNFSNLPESAITPIGTTIASPLEYGYRTKITPHFDAPPKSAQKAGAVDSENPPDWLKIGFNQVGTRKVMDIEECPIATPTLNESLGPLRKNIIEKIHTYKKGVSLLLRDSLEIPPTQANESQKFTDILTSSSEKHVCVTDHKGTVRERVGDKLFEYVAGSFFQNNNSVLLPLTSYVRDAIFPPSSTIADPSSHTARPRPTHLVDAYCGSGLFALTLAPHFGTVAGIELSADSIRSATHNAALNGLTNCRFMAGDAAHIFDTVQDFPRAETVLIIDPPRKGTDERFIEQLLAFACETVVYVSCNVHTQARDVGMILRKSEERDGRRYVLETLRGFDLFPQTAHVESVAVLRLE
ncbi:tRNA methyltransferase [Wolfiporia cocos MD-104 SS10]|uniref:tRNA methyltransferase n=1 Tax=Wolfiporia cocos (strain MD-104) TaxID=742152 RepID=A0A2H3IT21_WOLCO|nr:tRNA methyltransferase [Wolfiporia cocos MD-104 SS10]